MDKDSRTLSDAASLILVEQEEYHSNEPLFTRSGTSFRVDLIFSVFFLHHFVVALEESFSSPREKMIQAVALMSFLHHSSALRKNRKSIKFIGPRPKRKTAICSGFQLIARSSQDNVRTPLHDKLQLALLHTAGRMT